MAAILMTGSLSSEHRLNIKIEHISDLILCKAYTGLIGNGFIVFPSTPHLALLYNQISHSWNSYLFFTQRSQEGDICLGHNLLNFPSQNFC